MDFVPPLVIFSCDDPDHDLGITCTDQVVNQTSLAPLSGSVQPQFLSIILVLLHFSKFLGDVS